MVSTTIDKTSDRRAAAQHALSEHLRLVSSGRIEEWLDLFAPDAVLEFPYAPAGVPTRVQGREALMNHMTHFPDTFDVRFVDLVFHKTADPSMVIAEFASVGHAVPTGKPYEQQCICVVYTDDDSRITRFVDFWNPLVAIEALSPSAGPDATNVADSFKN
ncbi:nuclear transport factor 2 family protein [Rhodococcoides yunnanense]|uniref:Nuclear transport factor 2 family protein n=1 Tax=Rhodococcoides yunnanense TaxID=278209 RepID=A0ABU4B6G3_9NOCA|nr:nuclear transport factor 2 family protein [Rhodococcus yunnanensis]MDV6259748.1 nuclear transport factor 2 family protein [Rhodococcus yunnanensis]